MKKLFLMLIFVAFGGATEVSAQSWLNSLGNKLLERAKDNVEAKAERAVDRVFDNAEDAIINGTNNNTPAPQPQPQPQPTPAPQPAAAAPVAAAEVAAAPAEPEPVSLEVAYSKSDFVAGDEIFFEDTVVGEQLGEFPSQWDLLKGNVEIAMLNGETVIQSVSLDDPQIEPLFDDMRNYLPEDFTLEFDFWVGPYAPKKDNNKASNQYYIYFYKPNSNEQCQRIYLQDWYGDSSDQRSSELYWTFEPISGGGDRSGKDDSFMYMNNSWNHLAISFNKRAMKIYVNGTRYANIPNTVAPGHFSIEFYRSGGYYQNMSSIKNVRIAKGAVPLYDRMMSDGKFITYGITFDIGKATIKPESMGEINRIVKLMTDNPELNFSVEGHTDSTGNAASNQTLSEQRSQAIVDKLVELGIAKDRLTAVGKGQDSPIADNSTDEGRAKNRRVEFVKI